MMRRIPRPRLSRAAVGLATLLLAASSAALAADPAAVWNHVRNHYVHGLPYGSTEDLGADAVPLLLTMLEDPQEEEWWYNVVLSLGIVGGTEVTEPLIQFFERWKTGEMTEESFYAITTVPAALGFVAAKGDPRALEYVRSCSRVGFYGEKGIAWTTEGRDADAVHLLLAQIAVKGLGYSATPEALEHLKAMQERPESPAVASALQMDVQEAIDIHGLIRTRGPRSYFRE
jgi:hypothetical protein